MNDESGMRTVRCYSCGKRCPEGQTARANFGSVFVGSRMEDVCEECLKVTQAANERAKRELEGGVIGAINEHWIWSAALVAGIVGLVLWFIVSR